MEKWSKEEFRAHFLEKRCSLSDSRREQAKGALYETLWPFLKNFDLVLSFSSFRGEIDTELLNSALLENRSLCLPRVEGETLGLYHVEERSFLKRSKWGLLEPDPSLSKRVEKVDILLAPGVVFDPRGHRIGYGKGYYDRLLEEKDFQVWGIGFSEQLFEGLLPVSEGDRAVERLYFF